MGNADGRLAFSTLGCPEWDFKTVAARAKALGFAAIEVRGIQDELSTHRIPAFLPENQAATRALLEENGLRICCAGTSATFHNAAGVTDALEEGRRAIDTCHAMGVPAIRVFGDLFPPGEAKETVLQRVADGIRALCDYSWDKTAGSVQIWQEVHGEFNAEETLAPLADLLAGCPLYGLVWDIAHTHRACEDGPLPFLRAFMPLVRHVHIRDSRAENGVRRAALPGEGDFPITAFWDALESNGYTGYYSFEWEKRWTPALPGPEEALPRYIKLMEHFFAERIERHALFG